MKKDSIKLKKLTPKYARELQEFMNNKKVLKELCFTKTKYTIQDAKKELEKNHKYKFVIFEKEKIIGKIGLIQQDNSKIFEVGYIISPSHRKKGLATLALKEICKKGFDDFNAIRIYARVLPENQISQKILRKCKFELEGHLKKSFYLNKKYHDELIFAKIK